MSFSYDNTHSRDLDLVRFHIGDTHLEGYYVEDEVIQYWLATKGSVGEAAVVCVRYIITQLSQPDFKLDWLNISNEEARKGYEDILRRLQAYFGISSTQLVTEVTAVKLWRADSYQDSDSVYDGSP